MFLAPLASISATGLLFQLTEWDSPRPCWTILYLLDFPKRLLSYVYRPQRSWAKVTFSQVCVKNSVHRGGEGVCLSACWDTPPGADTPPRADPPGASPHTPIPTPEQTPPGSRPPPPGSRLQHTVNERPVRILLECILVGISNCFYTRDNVVGQFRVWLKSRMTLGNFLRLQTFLFSCRLFTRKYHLRMTMMN